jgi:hypothetical protein
MPRRPQNQILKTHDQRPSRRPSKERLLHLLAEAAELEHNLLCSYLFAQFGLKDGLPTA